MAKRKPNRLIAAMLPDLRDWLVEDLREVREGVTREEMLAYLDRQLAAARAAGNAALVRSLLDQRRAPDEDEAWAGREEALARGDLWWVTKPMTKLARAASGSVPEWTPSLVRPAPSGMLIWEGGTGIRVTGGGWMGQTEDRGAHAMGVTWWMEHGAVTLAVLTQDSIGDKAGPGAVSFAPGADGGVDELGRAQWESMQPIWDMVAATWLLAQQPSVGRSWGIRYDRRDPDRPFARPKLPSQIKVIALREVDAAGGGGDGIDPDILGSSQERRLTRRHMVRGHWRQQACGPQRKMRRPTYVVPYVKGPAGTELVAKETVHVWRR